MFEVETFLDEVAKNVVSGKKVFVHCFSGLGRTMTMVRAYKLAKGGIINNCPEHDLWLKVKRGEMIKFYGKKLYCYGGASAVKKGMVKGILAGVQQKQVPELALGAKSNLRRKQLGQRTNLRRK